jgi:hypothetical protein
MEQALQLTREEIEGEVDQALQPLRRQVQDQVEQTLQQPRPEGRSGAGGRRSEAAEKEGDEQEDASSRSAGIFGMAGTALKSIMETGQRAGDQAESLSPLGVASTAVGAALKETVTRLVNTLRELLQTVKGLLQTVVSLLRLILVALREGLTAAVRPLGEGLGAVVGKVAGAATS